MKRKFVCLAAAIAMLSGIDGAAQANDYARLAPGVRMAGGGVPVPAPAPIPDSPARWYFRADVALGIPSDASIRESGLRLGAPPPGGSGTFRTSPGWFKDSAEIYDGYSFGVGYIFSRAFRGDLTIDTRSEREFKAQGARYTYQNPIGTNITGTFSDSTKMQSVATLFNLYYDFHGRGRFVPYIGAGLGFAVNDLNRNNSTVESGGLSFSGSESATVVSLAAMGTIGFTYNIDPTIALDFNYRLLFVGGSDISMPLNGRTSTVHIGDQIDHQLRAGVRFNVY